MSKKDKKYVYLIQQLKNKKKKFRKQNSCYACLIKNNQCHFDHVGLDTCVRKLILFIVIYSTDFQNVLKTNKREKWNVVLGITIHLTVVISIPIKKNLFVNTIPIKSRCMQAKWCAGKTKHFKDKILNTNTCKFLLS